MIHPDTALRFISPEKGYGVVATKFIPKGTITWIMDPLDQVFSPERVHQFPQGIQEILATYSYRDHNGDYVLCWDNARFVNHSFHSNCISTAYNFELAVRDIQAGEELTDDYGYLNLTEPFDCIHEKDTSRTRVMPDDLLHFYPEWDEQLKDAFLEYNKVSQPLAAYIERQYDKKVRDVAAGNAEMDSILNCYYHTPETIVL